jgi:hypothetical protein
MPIPPTAARSGYNSPAARCSRSSVALALPPAIIYTNLDKGAPPLVGHMIQVDAAVLIPALNQVNDVLEHLVELHDEGEQARA